MDMLNPTGRAVIAILTLLGCAATIMWLLAFGNPTNSLHDSALSWSYFLILAILIGLGVTSALPSLLDALPKRTS